MSSLKLADLIQKDPGAFVETPMMQPGTHTITKRQVIKDRSALWQKGIIPFTFTVDIAENITECMYSMNYL